MRGGESSLRKEGEDGEYDLGDGEVAKAILRPI